MNTGLILGIVGIIALLFLMGMILYGIYQKILINITAAKLAPQKLVVFERKNHTENLFTFKLRHPLFLPLKKFKAGQYLTFTISTGGTTVKRSYSIASWSKYPFFYEFGIKKEEKGIGSTWLFDNLKNGAKIEVSAPSGHFNLGQKTKKIVFIAGGIGITPLRSMIQSIYSDKGIRYKDIAIFLFYSNRTPQDILYHEEFQKWQKNHSNFYYIPIVTRAKSTDYWDGEMNRISSQMLQDYLGDFGHTSFYLCAGNELMEAIQSSLIKHGVDPQKIIYESFGVAIADNVVESKLKIECDSHTFELGNAPSLFHALEQRNVPSHGTCRAGHCGLCKMYIHSGEVKYLINPNIKLNDGEILPCCCIASTDIKISQTKPKEIFI